MASSQPRPDEAPDAKASQEGTARLRPVPDTQEGNPPLTKRQLRRQARRADNAKAAGTLPPAAAPANRPKTKRELRREARQAKREAAKARAEADAEPVVVRPLAPAAKVRKRHWGLGLAFVLMVLAPVAAASWYLYTRAADQYASTLGFTVRSEEMTSASDLLGGLGSSLGSGASHDSDILYEYVRSQEMVRRIDQRLDLRAMYSRHHETDPLLSFDPEGSIEDLVDYWDRMLSISYDAGAGLLELRVLAFDPQEAQAIAEAIYDESLRTINALSAVAREDATRYAQLDLDQALERLKQAREALTAFRVENQIVDPSADIQGQMGLLNTLQGQLAGALIELDLLRDNTSETDPRLTQAQRRIEVIRARLEEERQKFGAEGSAPGGGSYATTISEFERLSVDREFAEQAYTAALSAYDAARAEADRQNRYLASYIQPTLAERSQFPQRELMIGIVALFGFLAWAIGSLVYYSLRDRN
ncbi:sugar transporter [Limimaricola sp. ASW11-118]|uniref:Sugar transporter n=1 Tax=Limimaricola litoreus TaxID=2955316 RepID=A0A9X2FRI2_9RHOB|nr:sugar transporter [Limimaricola litoreus]MCP1170381.1 sugar transporter [Limimaricola litoreus]